MSPQCAGRSPRAAGQTRRAGRFRVENQVPPLFPAPRLSSRSPPGFRRYSCTTFLRSSPQLFMRAYLASPARFPRRALFFDFLASPRRPPLLSCALLRERSARAARRPRSRCCEPTWLRSGRTAAAIYASHESRRCAVPASRAVDPRTTSVTARTSGPRLPPTREGRRSGSPPLARAAPAALRTAAAPAAGRHASTPLVPATPLTARAPARSSRRRPRARSPAARPPFARSCTARCRGCLSGRPALLPGGSCARWVCCTNR